MDERRGKRIAGANRVSDLDRLATRDDKLVAGQHRATPLPQSYAHRVPAESRSAAAAERLSIRGQPQDLPSELTAASLSTCFRCHPLRRSRQTRSWMPLSLAGLVYA